MFRVKLNDEGDGWVATDTEQPGILVAGRVGSAILASGDGRALLAAALHEMNAAVEMLDCRRRNVPYLSARVTADGVDGVGTVVRVDRREGTVDLAPVRGGTWPGDSDVVRLPWAACRWAT